MRPTERGRKIARTVWGLAWCDNLERYHDYANRLPRGRTYIRNGSVVHLEISAGKVLAQVAGSSMYRVEITIAPLPAPRWRTITGSCARGVASMIELLEGRLSADVMAVMTARGTGLFPEPREIELRCSCPDWATMCKHVAAVMYGVGVRLDDTPQLLFALRGVDASELVAQAAASAIVGDAGTGSAFTDDALSSIFGIELADAPIGGEASRAKRPGRRKAGGALPAGDTAAVAAKPG
ncbi:MAG: SWIM zinc finger family protein, partial [Deltaproteobacteria bacterium]|nr:SWIM zinc finger family protein [Nannocystaceae bacterium]